MIIHWAEVYYEIHSLLLLFLLRQLFLENGWLGNLLPCEFGPRLLPSYRTTAPKPTTQQTTQKLAFNSFTKCKMPDVFNKIFDLTTTMQCLLQRKHFKMLWPSKLARAHFRNALTRKNALTLSEECFDSFECFDPLRIKNLRHRHHLVEFYLKVISMVKGTSLRVAYMLVLMCIVKVTHTG